METVIANLSTPRRVSEAGRDYIVAPLTLIVPGVLNGSQGALYYPPDEIQRTTEAWNGVPITLRHPRKDGRLVPAREGGVVLGDVRNATYQDKLTAEGWFDVANLEKESPQLLRSIESGERGELSTGLYTENKPVKNGQHNGRAYTHVATNYRPDHLAILPDETGACSVDDGCGVNVNKDNRGALEKLVDLYHQTANTLAGLLGAEPGKTGDNEPSTNEETDMAMTAAERKSLIDNLVGCCWDADDRSELEQLTDNQLTAFSKLAEEKSELDLVANAARETFGLGDVAVNALPEAFKKAAAKKGGDEEEEEEEDVDKKKKTENTSPPTEEEWLAQAPQGIRDRLDFAANVMAEQRQEAIDTVTANLSGDEKARVEKHLATLSLDQIRDFAVLVPKPRPTANYGTVPAADAGGEKETPLGTPTWNFEPAE